MFKYTYLTKNTVENTLMGVIKEVFSNDDMNIWQNVDIQIFQSTDYPKLIVRVVGNFKTIEETMDEAWENNKY